ncbi:MAG: hypothetical protein ACR2KX_10140, partial [Chitinophagaceae bacterium]
MNYHIPDDRWQNFGFNNFKKYCDKEVVKGRFHPCVPKDITEAFIIAEYIMAHAYYHYHFTMKHFPKYC